MILFVCKRNCFDIRRCAAVEGNGGETKKKTKQNEPNKASSRTVENDDGRFSSFYRFGKRVFVLFISNLSH